MAFGDGLQGRVLQHPPAGERAVGGYGRWMVRTRGSLPQTNRQLRFAVHTHEYSALLYSASEIEVVRRDELESIPYLARLGPGVLDPAIDEAMVRERLRDPLPVPDLSGELVAAQASSGSSLRSSSPRTIERRMAP